MVVVVVVVVEVVVVVVVVVVVLVVVVAGSCSTSIVTVEPGETCVPAGRRLESHDVRLVDRVHVDDHVP